MIFQNTNVFQFYTLNIKQKNPREFISGILVEATGLEPAASWSQTKHSTKLSYASLNIILFI